MHLSQAVVIDEIRSVSVDQSVEGQTVLPAVRQKTDELSRKQSSNMTLVGLCQLYLPLSSLQSTVYKVC